MNLDDQASFSLDHLLDKETTEALFFRVEAKDPHAARPDNQTYTSGLASIVRLPFHAMLHGWSLYT